MSLKRSRGDPEIYQTQEQAQAASYYQLENARATKRLAPFMPRYSSRRRRSTRPYARRSTSRSRFARPGRAARVSFGGPLSDSLVINRCPRANMKVAKLCSIGTFTGTTSGSNEEFPYNAVFDPSGTYGVHSGTAVDGWNILTQLFDSYKVNFIDINFTVIRWPLLDVENVDGEAATNDNGLALLQIRDLYDPQATVSSGFMSALRNVQIHKFDRGAGGSVFQYRIYPKTVSLNVGSSGTTSVGYKWSPAGWLDIDLPSSLFGAAIVLQLPDGMTVSGTATYNISFTQDH